MNHGSKINGNILEIALPEEVRIDKVIVNRKIFSQRQRVCESCKYHGLEGHEEPCVSCEVGNSNYVPSVGLEERMEERTETHACDSISRQAAIDIVEFECGEWMGLARTIIKAIEQLPSAQPEIIRCKNCKWWDKSEDSPFGYCMAMKHGYMTANWEIGIYRRYKGDFYCADAERRTDE